MTPTAHEKAEWARLAQDAYAHSLNHVGHRYSAAAALANDAELPLGYFDSLQRDYRYWLINGLSATFRILTKP